MITLFTLTGQSASGKDYLQKKLLEDPDFTSITSVTSRLPRANETEGDGYYFRSEKEIVEMDKRNEFAELIRYGDTYYGTTHLELNAAAALADNLVLILTPAGVAAYENIAIAKGWKTVRAFVHAPEAVRFERMNNRLMDNIKKADNAYDMAQAITSHTTRIANSIRVESQWESEIWWDVRLSGEDTEEAISRLKNFTFKSLY